MPAQKLSAQVGGSERAVIVEPRSDGRWRVVIDGRERIVDAKRVEGQGWSLLIDGRVHQVDLDPTKDGDTVAEVRGRAATVKLLDSRRKLLLEAQATAQRARASSGPLAVRAPMPGKVVKLLARPGDRVTAGQGIVVVEAMKMENELRAPRDGVVAKVHVAEGQTVEAQEALVTLD